MNITNFDDICVKPPITVVEWAGSAAAGKLRLLDQTKLPNDICFLDCETAEAVWDAIQRLVVRGAPAIGVAAAYGLVVAAQPYQDKPWDDFLAGVNQQADYLNSSRPTAVNLAWALNRVRQKLADSGIAEPAAAMEFMLAEAKAIHEEDERMCLQIGREAAKRIAECGPSPRLLTHCNAGALATAGVGTATAGMYVAAVAGMNLTVYCDETRPLLQGSRLTSWELSQAGIHAVVITDNMTAQVLKEGRVDMIIVGSDRIAANGDAANKIGTYGVAILAKYHNIPFYVAAPYSTFDLSLTSGADIPIELRGEEEITCGFGKRTAPEGIDTYSPAFDVTPAELIAGIFTEKGLISPVNEEQIRNVLG